MFRRLLTGSIIILAALVLARQGDGQTQESMKTRLPGPIAITSDRLTADNKAKTAVFQGHVVAKKSDATLYADSMTVYFGGDRDEVEKIEAAGNVRMLRKGRVIFAQAATYYNDSDKVVFTGEPRAVDGENVVTGSEITYYVGEDRSVVEKGKVFLKDRKGE